MDLLIQYAMSFVNVPYLWAGNSPLVGIDCSGYVCELLRSVGLVGIHEDLTAQELHDRFTATGTLGVRGAGVLAFYGHSVTKVTHVAFMIDAYRILEAGGGGKAVTTGAAAAQADARVRQRLLEYRADLVATVKPRYGTIGLV
jgi:cell wall-associated NlpC family hydrolase